MFTVVSFTVTKTWKQPGSPSMDGKWCVYAVKCVVCRRNDILPFGVTWMALEGVVLIKIRQQGKTNTAWFESPVECKKNSQNKLANQTKQKQTH